MSSNERTSPETALDILADARQHLMFNRALEADKAIARAIAVLTSGHAQSPAVPDGYAVLPRKLTAENGAKAALIGEFYETTTVIMDENGDERTFKVPVSWDTIKRIWDAAVLHFSISVSSTDREGK